MPLRVTVELIPHGDESRKKVIGIMDIVNNCKGTTELGSYDISLSGPVIGSSSHDIWRGGNLAGFKRSRGYWSCVRECLNAVETDYEPR